MTGFPERRLPPFDGARLGALIERLLDERGMTRRDLAEAVDSHRNYIDTILRDEQRDIGLDLLTRVARELDVTVAAFASAAFGIEHRAEQARVVAPGGARPLGQLLRARRVALFASALDIAAATGQHPNYLTSVERGGVKPRLSSLLRLTYSLVWDDQAHLQLATVALQTFAGELDPPPPSRGLQGRRRRPDNVRPLRRYPYSR